MTKFVDTKMGAPFEWGRQNSNFLTTHARHMKLSEAKDKIWWYQNKGIPLKQERQNSNLNHLC